MIIFKLKSILNKDKIYTLLAVSTISAGKKEFMTKNKRRMQKRFLTAPLKILHKKLLLETNVKVIHFLPNIVRFGCFILSFQAEKHVYVLNILI